MPDESKQADIDMVRGFAMYHPDPNTQDVAIQLLAAMSRSADDIRAQGWSVAVHNDYCPNGEPHTFWLFTKDGMAIKGEGRTDAEALGQVRQQLWTRDRDAG